MLTIILALIFAAVVILVLTFVPPEMLEIRPRLQPLGHEAESITPKKKKSKFFLRRLALFNRPLCLGPLGRRVARDLALAKIDMAPEEFLFIKEVLIVLALVVIRPFIKPDTVFFWVMIAIVIGYMAPEFWLKRKIKRIKNEIIRRLPDTIDLLGLCVNAGLDFMLALKWVVEKSPKSVIIDELNLVMQEINVGKARRAALSDLARKFELPDLSTFSRTLIQADRMGTSVAEALNILSEDMRLARFRRGEQIALKAPLKMLVPLLFFIFPVVAVLVGGPIFLEFIKGDQMQHIGGGIGVGQR